MRAGKLRHIIDIEYRCGDTDDGYGNPIQSWEKLYQDIPAEIKANPATETVVGAEVQSQMTYTVNTRYLPDVNSTQRIIFDGRIFNISGVDDVLERHIELIITCKEVIAPLVAPTYKVQHISGAGRILKRNAEPMEGRSVIV
jgi:SPP1 family predicted phage head-tail adaptor